MTSFGPNCLFAGLFEAPAEEAFGLSEAFCTE